MKIKKHFVHKKFTIIIMILWDNFASSKAGFAKVTMLAFVSTNQSCVLEKNGLCT